MKATFQELQATICCPDGRCMAEDRRYPKIDKCGAWAYEDNARAVERLLGIELPGRPLREGERP